MKKLLLSFSAACSVLALNAQVVNGDLETWASGEPSNWTYDYGGGVGVQPGTNNFVVGLGEGDPATTTQITGAGGTGSAAELETKAVVGATLTAAGYTNIPGLLQGQWAFTGSPVSIEFDVDVQPVAGDSALFQAVIYDASGTELGYTGAIWTNATATSDWTSVSMDFIMTGSGTVAMIELWATASYSEDGSEATGSVMRVDNFMVVEGASGVEVKTALEFSAYPNPATTTLNIKTDETVESIVVYSLDGKVVTSSSNETSVDVTNLISGAYIYEVTTVNGTVSRDTFMKK